MVAALFHVITGKARERLVRLAWPVDAGTRSNRGLAWHNLPPIRGRTSGRGLS